MKGLKIAVFAGIGLILICGELSAEEFNIADIAGTTAVPVIVNNSARSNENSSYAASSYYQDLNPAANSYYNSYMNQSVNQQQNLFLDMQQQSLYRDLAGFGRQEVDIFSPEKIVVSPPGTPNSTIGNLSPAGDTQPISKLGVPQEE